MSTAWDDARHGRQTIKSFYDAFARRDGDAMAACYAPGVSFRDPAFGELRGDEAGEMWRMLTGRATDLTVTLAEHDDTTAHWLADYPFNTGRRVHNDVRATFTFDADGRISDHEDAFSFHAWARQALGPVGLALGWTPLLQRKVQDQARSQLEAFRAAG